MDIGNIFEVTVERRNLLIGVIWIFVFLILGFFIEMQVISTQETWKQGAYHGLFKAAYVFGITFGILNILYALIIRNYSLQGDKMIRVGSLLAFIAAFLLPVSLFLGAFERALMVGAPVGGIIMIIAYGVLALSFIKNSSK